MAENPTPRQIVKSILQGSLPARPLFLPIVFSLGARLENVPLRAFLGNPTKISNSLRQIRTHLRSDGVACSFDPYLEVEALGATLEWNAGDQPSAIRWPRKASKGELPEGLRLPEDAAMSGRVAVGLEVIRRLKSLLRDDPLLMAGVAGPFTLAARLLQLQDEPSLRREVFPDSALELAASLITHLAKAFVEAGASVIFLQENILPVLTSESCEAWMSALSPVFNIIRFYEALPVLLLSDNSFPGENGNLIFQQRWDCVVCLPLDAIPLRSSGTLSAMKSATLGIALPATTFQSEESGGGERDHFLGNVISELQPVLVTTAGDLPASIDMKRIIKVSENVQRGI